MRLIDADALKKAMDGYWGRCQRIRKPRNGETAVFLDVMATVEKQPTIDAVPIRRGRWYHTIVEAHDVEIDPEGAVEHIGAEEEPGHGGRDRVGGVSGAVRRRSMRLIDADAFGGIIKDGGAFDEHATIIARNAMLCMPTVDAVPVIRCKDCMFYQKDRGKFMAQKFRSGDGICKMHNYAKVTAAKDFCSWAKREEE